ncbi:branched-chain amino acid transport system substrate-binding protein [Williamsia muralis]|uniref:Branched-chain amino acid transport system substrate-binding protein n=1 Tax=Williamsia marianensis TaxID=85044 RepID=A0A495K9K7_WILMA|nr:ABC transporter substrate-binding protein [Williamsia muralis]RKR97485.1 branched-chain amino acid transport system substrate-binding protein [Williamsia muralis]
MKFYGRRRQIASVLFAGVLVAGLAACGSDDDGGGGGGSSTAADQSALGTANKATGTPITFGFISEGAGQTINTTDEIRGAQAAAAYANDYLGGLGGHPIEVKVCETLGVPATATDCANQMVAAKASAVLGGSIGVLDSVISVLAPAKIPLIMQTAPTQAGLTTPGVFSLFNSLSLFGGPAEWAKEEGLKKVDQVVIAVPAAQGAAKIGETLFTNAGLEVNTTAVPPGTADMSPQIASAAEADPDLYHIAGSTDFCTSAIKAIKTVSPQAKVVIIERCISPQSSSAIPGGYDGVKVSASADLNPDLESVKLFTAVLDKYGDGTKVSSMSNYGYSPMLGAINALNAAKIADVTPAGVMAAIKSAPPTELPNSDGIMFQCNGKQIAFSPNTCSADGILATADKDGNLSGFQRIPADPALYKLPGS